MDMLKIHVLGTAQDAGIPQLGCECENCAQALESSNKSRMVACIAIIGAEQILLIDSTPDYQKQVKLLSKSYPKTQPYTYNMGADQILITHLHIGHYTGLINLGKEVASTHNYPVLMTEKCKGFILANKPFSYLIERGEIQVSTLVANTKYPIDPLFDIEPIEVPHRNEDGDTIGVKIYSHQSQKTVIYIPDVDYLTDEILEVLKNTDLAILDGTFYSKTEHPRQASIPHPPILDTITKLGKRSPGSFYFTHFNHTNPILRNQAEYDYVKQHGYEILNDDQILKI